MPLVMKAGTRRSIVVDRQHCIRILCSTEQLEELGLLSGMQSEGQRQVRAVQAVRQRGGRRNPLREKDHGWVCTRRLLEPYRGGF